MRRAFVDGEKKEVMFSGQTGKCECCGNEVRGKKGRIRPAYWSHINLKDCDSWYEPISQWHLDWQNKFPEKYQEIKLSDEVNGELHRADIQFPNGFVIEVQNSPIAPEEIEEREKFYGRKGMIWILNGQNLCAYSKVSFEFIKREFRLDFSYLISSTKNAVFGLDTFNERLFELTAFNNIYNHPKLSSREDQNGCFHFFEFSESVDVITMMRDLKDGIRGILISLYGNSAYSILEEFEFKAVENSHSHFKRITLHKKRWREFINYMKKSVYIDNMPGVSNDHIYNLYENNIILKKDFVIDLMEEYAQ